ncbi:MAG: response regulator [Deltaproteobacteria bacterium]|nr:response regulator [Deltaproteobacteria bacterium]
MSARAHVALGQTFLLGTLLMIAMLLGIIPDEERALLEGRATLAEAVAVNGSALVTQSNLNRLEATLGLIVGRNDDLLSASVRHESGRALVTIGNHQELWRPTAEAKSTGSQIVVPLWSRDRPWGQVELRFRPLRSEGWLGYLQGKELQLMAFMSLLSFGLFYLYLGKMLELLDPSQAVPPHVRSALDSLAEGLLVMDSKERIVLANQAFAGLVGRTADDLMGQKVGELDWITDEDDSEGAAVLPWTKALTSGESQLNDMIRILDFEGNMRTFILNCSPVLGSGDQAGGALISLDDVTQLEEHKAKLSAAKGEAEAANQAKSEFLANMSHEIRTPMNSILGFTDVLRRGYEKNEVDRQKYLSTIRSSGEHLLQLINDVLDLSKVESGRLEVENIAFAPHTVIQEVVNLLSIKAKEKQISLTFEPEGLQPAQIHSDPTRLRQIITNLASNAIRFTDQGGVTLRAKLIEIDQGLRFCIEVRDTGMGVPDEAKEAIFDPFVQADSSVTRRFGGTGLGLPISRRFARILGGDIIVGSDPSGGSIFAVIIDPGPLDGVQLLGPEELSTIEVEPVLPGSAQWHFPEARVLVVDDGEENRELVGLVLEEVGLVVDGAENGQVGVEMARRIDYDVILMDMQMPVMDGYTATKALRSEGIETPIYALTANAMDGFEQECIAIGCCGYLVKPVEIDLLLDTMAALLGGQRAAVPTPAPSSSAESFGSPVAEPEIGTTDSRLVSRLASNPRFRPIIEKFVGRLAIKLEAMESAHETGDLTELASLAHWLKGAGGMVGFDEFHGPAETLEILAKEAKLEEIETALSELRGLAARIALPGEVES